MDQAVRGASALSSSDFGLAIKHYTDAIGQNPGAVDYYIKRSTAYTRLSPSDHASALADAEVAVSLASKRAKRELIAQSQLRRAISLFGLERYADSQQCLQWVKKFDEKEKALAIWDMKIKGKMKGMEADDKRAIVSVQEVPQVEPPKPSKATITKSSDKGETTDSTPKIPDTALREEQKPEPVDDNIKAAKTPAEKIRHDWIQSSVMVTVSLYCKGIPKDEIDVKFKEDSLTVDFPLANESQYCFSLDPLFFNIDPAKSSYKIMSTKAEFTLWKAQPGKKWSALESSEPTKPKGKEGEDSTIGVIDVPKSAAPATAPAYPTSSKKGPKNWDNVTNDLFKKKKKDSKDGGEDKEDKEDEMEDLGLDEEEGDPTNNFFKMLYAGADPDTRRAMMKSYQESNGTALSTNWAEVGKGPVETSPPDGMEAKKWDA